AVLSRAQTPDGVGAVSENASRPRGRHERMPAKQPPPPKIPELLAGTAQSLDQTPYELGEVLTLARLPHGLALSEDDRYHLEYLQNLALHFAEVLRALPKSSRRCRSASDARS